MSSSPPAPASEVPGEVPKVPTIAKVVSDAEMIRGTAAVTVDGMKTVSIIGSSFAEVRFDMSAGTDASLNIFQRMCYLADLTIRKKFKFDCKSRKGNVILVSGGAAWADHVAVELFLNRGYSNLILYTPCHFSDGRHDETKGGWNRQSAAKIANERHAAFSAAIGRDTLGDIELARQKGARIMDSSDGFYARNKAIALSHFMIALTWSLSGAPETPGTLYTWSKAAPYTKKQHISLGLDVCICQKMTHLSITHKMPRKTSKRGRKAIEKGGENGGTLIQKRLAVVQIKPSPAKDATATAIDNRKRKRENKSTEAEAKAVAATTTIVLP